MAGDDMIDLTEGADEEDREDSARHEPVEYFEIILTGVHMCESVSCWTVDVSRIVSSSRLLFGA
jgi:hypothetical protein